MKEFIASPPSAAIDISALSREFHNSGIAILDALWTKPSALYRDRMSAAGSMGEASRRLDPMQRADLAYHLVIRLPLAIAHGELLGSNSTASLISECVTSLVQTNPFYREGDFLPFLKRRIDEILDAIIWCRRSSGKSGKDISSVLTLATFLLGEEELVDVGKIGMDAVDRLYQILDANLDPLDFDESGWFELYRYCEIALPSNREGSRLRHLGDQMPELVEKYKALLVKAAGERIADALFSNNHTMIWTAAKEGLSFEGAGALFKFLGAWNLRPSAVGRLEYHDPQSRLQVLLEANLNWREMYPILRWFFEQPLSLTDAQMAALVRSMALTGGYPDSKFIKHAFAACRDGSHPETYQALKGMQAAEQRGSPQAYVEMLKWLKLRLLLLDAFLFANGLLGRKPIH